MVKRTFSPEFKARVTLEALREEKTVNQIAGEYEVSPSMVARWKAQTTADLHQIFAAKTDWEKEKSEYEARQEELYGRLGRLQMELDWLKKKYPC